MSDLLSSWPNGDDPYDHLPLGVCVIDQDLCVHGWNRTLVGWTGVSKKDALASNLTERYPNLRHKVYADRLRQVFDSGQSVVFSNAIHSYFIPITRQSESGDRLMAQRATVSLLEVNDRRFALIVMEDVSNVSDQAETLRSERDRLKLALEEIGNQSEKLNFAHAIVQSSQDAIIATSLDGTIKAWNEGARRLFHFDSEKVLGTTLTHIVSPPHREEIQSRYQKLIQGEFVEPHDSVFLRNDNSPVEVSVTLSTVRDTNGKTSGVSCIAHGIGARRKAENESAYMSAIIESTDDAVIGVLPGGQIAYWNESAEDLYGFTKEEAIGMSHSALTPPCVASEVVRLMEAAGRGERTDHYDTVRQHKDGSLVEISLNVSPIRDSEGKIIGVSKVSRDISERKKTEAALQQTMQEVLESHNELSEMKRELEVKNEELGEATRLANQASKAKGEFLANMSHEIRTPMTAILGYADLLLDEEATPSGGFNRPKALKTIKQNGEYLLELINDVLDISKVEAGKLEVELIDCSPEQVLTEVQELMRVRATEKNLTLELDIDSSVPKLVSSDPTRLRQVMINLIGNAIKFTEQGWVRLSLDCLPDEKGVPTLRFRVADSGIGMTKEQTARLFNPFTQADQSTTRKYGGTGLGLSISKRLVELVGGTISVTSVPGEGTTFQVLVPARAARTPLSQPHEQNSQEARSVVHQDQIDSNPGVLDTRVLLAEDGLDNQRLISLILRKAGAEVEVAENGQIAVDRALAEAADDRPFDVILMDMQMPILDGYHAARKLRDEGYHRPIIALTAHAMASDRQKCLDAGCDDFATKPIERSKLISLIANYSRSKVEALSE